MKKLIAYITTSYPNKEFSIDVINNLKEAGADGVELGIPFSDPVADGEIIQEANKKALENGFKIKDIFEVSKNIDINTYWMGYFNNFYRKGYDFMVEKAKELNIKGFIIPDLPYEEAIPYSDKFPLISFVAPTDNKERIKKILQNPKEFIYLVAYTGITGTEKKENLEDIISNIREVTSTPIYIGFGVNEKTAKEKSKNVDGVIVGSRFIKILLNEDSFTSKLKEIYKVAKIIKEEINS